MSIDLLSKYGFKSLRTKFSSDTIIERMKRDKKAQADKISFIIPIEKRKVEEIKLSFDDIENMFIEA